MAVLAPPRHPGLGLVVSVSDEGAAAVIVLRGEAELAARPGLVDLLIRSIADHEGPVVIDLAQVELLDCAIVMALERAGVFLSGRGRRLVLRSPSRRALPVLAGHGVSHLIEAVPQGHGVAALPSADSSA